MIIRKLWADPDWDNSERVVLHQEKHDPRAVEVALALFSTVERLRVCCTPPETPGVQLTLLPNESANLTQLGQPKLSAIVNQTAQAVVLTSDNGIGTLNQ